MYTEKDYLMWLTKTGNFSNNKLNCIRNYFGCYSEAFYAKKEWLRGITNLSDKDIDLIVKNQNSEILEKYKEELLRKRIDFITRDDTIFPKKLLNIPDSPLYLYIKGKLPEKELKYVSIVGSRRTTEYGSAIAYKFAKELSEYGVVIVSGMASGIDAVAHKGCLDGKGKTIAVFGCGIDICYPENNRNLMERILQDGCIISEYSTGVEPFKGNFPMRNRIISGMSDAVVVIEASLKSGTMITVNHALEQNKDIFALPGNITSKYSQGTNLLIKQGAYPITEIDDILLSLGINKDKKINSDKKEKITLETQEKIVYDCMSLVPITVEELILKTGMQISQLQYILTMLEIKCLIKKLPGQKYICSV